jgi:hypothetical protein
MECVKSESLETCTEKQCPVYEKCFNNNKCNRGNYMPAVINDPVYDLWDDGYYQEKAQVICPDCGKPESECTCPLTEQDKVRDEYLSLKTE